MQVFTDTVHTLLSPPSRKIHTHHNHSASPPASLQAQSLGFSLIAHINYPVLLTFLNAFPYLLLHIFLFQIPLMWDLQYLLPLKIFIYFCIWTRDSTMEHSWIQNLLICNEFWIRSVRKPFPCDTIPQESKLRAILLADCSINCERCEEILLSKLDLG